MTGLSPDLVYGASSNRPLRRLPDLGHDMPLLGLRAICVPPGAIDAAFVFDRHTIDFNSAPVVSYMAAGSDRERSIDTPRSALAWGPAGFDISLRVNNPAWSLSIEIEETRLDALNLEATQGSPLSPQFRDYDASARAEPIAQMIIEHIRFSDPDPLFIEGLSLAMIAEASRIQLGQPAARTASTVGTDARITRALDYAEAHLGESLSVGDLAAVANMSPSWFAQSFRAELGKPVHAYIRERRLERARILLGQRTLTLQQVAHTCGFSDQAHMTRAFKRRFGTTPAKARGA